MAALVMYPQNADACSAPLCWGGFIAPSHGDLPASVPAFFWRPMTGEGSMPDASGAEMVRVTPNGEVLVAVDVTPTDSGGFLIAPAAALDPDADYVVRGANYCDADGLGAPATANIHTTAAVALPGELGFLPAAAPFVGELDVTTVSGSCYATITAAQAALDIELSPEAQPWASALLYLTLVDGKLWNKSGVYALSTASGAFRGESKDTLYAHCKGDDDGADKGLSEGAHTVVMRATLAGTDLALETAPITVTLDCTPPVLVDPGPDPNKPGDSSADVDASSGCSASGAASAPGGGAGLWMLVAGIAALSMGRGRSCRRTARSSDVH